MRRNEDANAVLKCAEAAAVRQLEQLKRPIKSTAHNHVCPGLEHQHAEESHEKDQVGVSGGLLLSARRRGGTKSGFSGHCHPSVGMRGEEVLQ